MLKAIFETVVFRLQIYIQVVQSLQVKYLIVCNSYINRKTLFYKYIPNHVDSNVM